MAGTVKITFIGDSSNLKKSLKEVQKQVDGTSSKMDKFSSKMSKTGDKLVGAGKKMSIGLTAPLALVGKVAFDAASDMEESMSKIDVVFGKSAKAIKAWADGSAQNMGLSKQAALEAAGTYGNLFQAFGIQQKPAQEMSQSLVQLASDLASFNNTSVEDALIALQSGVSGETEPLKKYGIAINEVRLKAQALKLGLIKAPVDLAKVEKANINVAKATEVYNKELKSSGKNSLKTREAQNKLDLANQTLKKTMSGGTIPTLTSAQKAQASYALIMADSELAQGDFARTSDGAANKLKIMQAEAKNASAELGVALIPIVKTATTVLTGMAKSFGGLSDGQKKAVVGVGLFAAAIGPITTVAGGMAKALSGGAKAASKVAKAGKKVKESYDKWKSIAPLLKEWSARQIKAKIETVKATVAVVRQTVAEKARLVITKAQAAATKVMTAVQAAFNAVMSANPVVLVIIAIVALVALFVILYKKNKAFRDFVKASWKAIGGAVKATFDVIKKVVLGVINWIKTNWKVLLVVFLGVFGLVIIAIVKYKDQIIKAFQLLWSGIKIVWDAIAAVIKFAWDKVIKPIWEILSWYITTIVIPAFKTLWSILQPIFKGIAKVIKDAWTNIIKPTMDKLVKIWETLRAGMKVAWDWISDKIVDKIKTLIGWINKLVKGVQKGIDKFKEFLGLKNSSGEESLQNLPTKDKNGKTVLPRQNVGGAPVALGGPVYSGRPYKVGEGGGAELFVPHTDGTIYNARQTRGMGSTYNVTMNVSKTSLTQSDLMVALKRIESLKVA